MKYTVTKEITFDSAHRLVNGYPGKCRHIHGHTWRVRMSMQSESLDQYGFVMDYADFKPMKNWVDENLDHAMLVSKDDGEMIKFLKLNEQQHYVFDFNPTSENLCRFLFQKAGELGLNLSAIEVDETCTSCARYAQH